MTTLFTKIITGEEPSFKIAEDSFHVAILEKKPIKKGHIVVFPKNPVDFIYDMEDEDLCRLHLFAKKISHALKKVIPCKKVGVAILGLEVPHAHIHLIPLDNVAELNFADPRLSFTDSEMNRLMEEIRSQL